MAVPEKSLEEIAKKIDDIANRLRARRIIAKNMQGFAGQRLREANSDITFLLAYLEITVRLFYEKEEAKRKAVTDNEPLTLEGVAKS